MRVKENIYNYFEGNPDLKVLFVFDSFIYEELSNEEWRDGYKAVKFDGGWFRVKYALENEWKDLKVILLFDRIAPTSQEVFPLMDVLVANMEYKSENYEAFLQQHRLDSSKFGPYIQRHLRELQLQKVDKILRNYYTPDVFSIDVANRGFISAYMGESKLLDWDNIIIKLFMLSLPSDEKKENRFYLSLSKNKDAKEALQRKLREIFDHTYEENDHYKLKRVAESMMYNAITQYLAVEEADNYKTYKINNAIALQHINKLLEIGVNQPKDNKEKFIEALNMLSSDIRVSELIKVYGVDANYSYLPEKLSWEIINRALSNVSISDTEGIREKMQELRLKKDGSERIVTAINYVFHLADFYNQFKQIKTFVHDSPDMYIEKYTEEYYRMDMNYRQSLETFHSLSVDIPILPEIDSAKRKLDLDYARYCNQLNLEWTRCWIEKGGTKYSFNYKQQQNFYKDERDGSVKQVIIVSDALRYEVAKELMLELGKDRHIAQLDCAMAMLPTETRYTKTALLPHRALTLQGVEMAVDGKVLPTINARSKHIANNVDDATCIDYRTWEQNSREDNREIFKKPLVYIFHNSIDKDGHDGGSLELTRACRTAINQLSKLIRNLHASQNVVNVVLTADHGFLYNDVKYEEKDKLAVQEEFLEKKTRYYITSSEKKIDNVVKFKMKDVSGINEDLMIAVPEGTNRLNAPGGGYNFTHGGASLQEMIIPVIRSRQKRSDKTEKVGVKLITRNLSMVSSRLKFQIIQSEAVSMEVLERTVVCGVYVNEELVTTNKEIQLSSADSVNAANRVFDVELTLNTSTDAKIMELRIYDASDSLNPLIKENVTNNTIIEQDF